MLLEIEVVVEEVKLVRRLLSCWDDIVDCKREAVPSANIQIEGKALKNWVTSF